MDDMIAFHVNSPLSGDIVFYVPRETLEQRCHNPLYFERTEKELTHLNHLLKHPTLLRLMRRYNKVVNLKSSIEIELKLTRVYLEIKEKTK